MCGDDGFKGRTPFPRASGRWFAHSRPIRRWRSRPRMRRLRPLPPLRCSRP